MLTKTSSAMLNRHRESGHPCHAHDFSGNALVLLLCGMILVVGLLYIAFGMLKYVPVSLRYLRLSS